MLFPSIIRVSEFARFVKSLFRTVVVFLELRAARGTLRAVGQTLRYPIIAHSSRWRYGDSQGDLYRRQQKVSGNKTNALKSLSR